MTEVDTKGESSNHREAGNGRGTPGHKGNAHLMVIRVRDGARLASAKNVIQEPIPKRSVFFSMSVHTRIREASSLVHDMHHHLRVTELRSLLPFWDKLQGNFASVHCRTASETALLVAKPQQKPQPNRARLRAHRGHKIRQHRAQNSDPTAR